MKKVIIAYVPVLHEGYRKFFERHKDVDTLYIFGDSLVKKYDYLAKEIRQLSPSLIKQAIESWKMFKKVEVLEEKDLNSLKVAEIIMPDEDVCHDLAKFFDKEKVIFDSIFLRWDKHKTMEEKPVQADQKISRDEFDREIIQKLKKEAEKSSDWWRRIASAIVKDGEVLFSAHNEHLPSPHSPYADGDPRNTLHKGIGIEYSTSIHSEARLIAEAARKGISLEGVSIYVSVFPCPTCAKQIAFSGIKKLYYGGGYQMLDQEIVLRSKGVEIIFVE
ncbi:MAG: deaminase [Patescibacteria group bacterium]